MLIAIQQNWCVELRTLGRDWWIITLRLRSDHRLAERVFEYPTLSETIESAYRSAFP